MNLFPSITKRYTREQSSALTAQWQAEFIAWSPIVFQVSRLMIKFGMLDLLRNNPEGLTVKELVCRTGLSTYAVKTLTDASLCIGIILVDVTNDKFSLSKTGWFLLTDPATRINLDFNHDVNYQGLFYLEEALLNGKPEGLKTLGEWKTIYEGLSELPDQVKESWFKFDHFYSDNSFDEALNIIFANHPKRLMDIGGNTGRFALRCVEYDTDILVTIVDLPGQIGMMRRNISGHIGAERINSYAVNLLDEDNHLPTGTWDAVWMSQFLDCFSEPQILSILTRATQTMSANTHLYIMETFWDRQRFETASFCLTMTSLYFTAMANGNSKMYHSDDIIRLVKKAGLEILTIHDGLGQGHTILDVVLK